MPSYATDLVKMLYPVCTPMYPICTPKDKNSG
nr:MAG TPA: hypothetical protein [Caudoviricetes sp.]